MRPPAATSGREREFKIVSDPRVTLPKTQNQDHWPHGPITVDLRPAQASGKVKAFADVTIRLGPDGAITISGFSILSANGQVPRVVPPARKGNLRYFDIVRLVGNIRRLVETAILNEYQQ